MYGKDFATLAGMKALITGGSGGIGEEIVRFFLSRGAKVIISGTSEVKLKATCDKLQKELSESGILDSEIEIVSANLANRDELLQLAEKSAGEVDIFVGNAGITADNLFMRMSDDEWDKVIATNLSANFFLTKALIRGMMKRKYGRIIYISSVVGSLGNPGQANYCASKAGLEGMMRSVAREIAGKNITVNAIAPGFIASDMTSKLTSEQKILIEANIPMQRIGTPQDIAPMVGFLASKHAGYITGQVIHINGGMYM